MDGTALAAARAVYAVAIAYFALGFVVAVAFVAAGIARIDPRAARSSIAFRLAILPGAICLWPAVLWRWRVAARRGIGADARASGRRVRSRAWLVALPLAGLILLAALAWRPSFPVQAPLAGTVPLSGDTRQ